MTTNKPGSVNQQPLYGCTCCYEDYTWPAGDLRVHDGECWCDLCWDERRWEFPDYPYWDDLEPYTPALQADYQRLQAERDKLLSIISDLKDWDCDVRGGFLSIPIELRRRMQEALDSARHEPGHDSDGMVE